MKRISTMLLILAIVIFLPSAFLPKENIAKKSPAYLGKLLFFDPILSADKTISCASCHHPALAFADSVAFSNGVGNKHTKRNTPSVMNMASRENFFFDGRAKTLEDQVLFPIQDENEMNCPIPIVIQRLNDSKKYKKLFTQIFHDAPNVKNLSTAIAAYEKTLETSNTANDRWLNDKPNGLTPQQIKGRSVFFEKGKCIECHFTPDFTGDEFKNIGLFDGKKWNDSGRYNFTKNINDIGKFKVPGLRNVAITAPYMHDGSFKTLRQVLEYYNHPELVINSTVARDTFLSKPLNLTEQEMQDLEAFLNGMTDNDFVRK